MAIHRLGRGPFEPIEVDFLSPEQPQIRRSVYEMRSLFLQAACELKPAMLDSLPKIEDEHAEGDEAALDLFRIWAKRWRLDENWCLDWAINRARRKQESEPAVAADSPRTSQPEPAGATSTRRVTRLRLTKFTFNSINLTAAPVIPPPFQFEVAGWNVGNEEWNAFAKRTIDRARQELRDYRFRAEQNAEAAGWETTPKANRESFLWLAGYQVAGWSCSRISDAVSVERQAVEHAIHQAARFIGLRLRPAREYDRGQTLSNIREALRRLRIRLG